MNPAQQQVVEADAYTPLLVVAGAGSGKTLTMVAILLLTAHQLSPLLLRENT
jgi:superfamily I DNA/RNA helicase